MMKETVAKGEAIKVGGNGMLVRAKGGERFTETFVAPMDLEAGQIVEVKRIAGEGLSFIRAVEPTKQIGYSWRENLIPGK
jgi:hypothetical protein